ncbi:unnamed protein product, partial [Closterium sp. Yama58-4]
MDDEPPGAFAYSQVFAQPITIHYQDGTLPAATGDALSSTSSLSSSSSPSSPTSMVTSILTVLPARGEVDAA